MKVQLQFPEKGLTKKFQFRLEPLLKEKSEIEKQKQKEVATVQRKFMSQQ